MIKWVLERFLQLIPLISELRKEQRQVGDAAARAISHALYETKLYYAGLERGNERNRDLEAMLSKHWAAASVPIRNIDQELAQVCASKAEYWINPEDWSEEQIKETGISLDKLHQHYKQQLHPKGFTKAGYRRLMKEG